VLFLYDTLKVGQAQFDETLVREHYSKIARYLGVDQPDPVHGAMGRDIQQPAPEGEWVVPLVLREGSFPVIGGVTQHFLLQMQHDGNSPTLHDLASRTPRDDVAQQYPEEFLRLQALTWGLHESARLMLFRNVR
jgi:hypothetical protein